LAKIRFSITPEPNSDSNKDKGSKKDSTKKDSTKKDSTKKDSGGIKYVYFIDKYTYPHLMKIFQKITSFIQSKQTNSRWLKLLIVLALLLLVVLYQRKYYPGKHTEGFEQNEKYLAKRDEAIYDDFYVGIYDYLQKTKERSKYELKKVVETTQPDRNNSVMLDVGCGTGCMVNVLRESGYRAFGIDKSEAMVSYSKQKYPDVKVKCGDANDSMAFDRASFTHILCMNATIYEFDDKVAFFRNCYHWLVPGGYMFLHLVNPRRFDPIVPAGKPSFLSSPQKYASTRITDTVIDFADFKYKSAYDFRKLDTTGDVTQTETFTDKKTGNVRENERTVQFVPEADIIDQVQMCRFLLEGQFSLKDYNHDDYQTIYILKKI